MTGKNLYRCVFSYQCEIVREFVMAYTQSQAKKIVCDRLAKSHGVHPSVVFSLFDGSKPNYIIEIDKDWREKQCATTAKN